jgi:hypothetical protein
MKITSASDKEIIKTAKTRFEIANSAWGTFFKTQRETLKFIDGDQWDNQLRQQRESSGLPVLTNNRLPMFLRQITNESRKNTPAIQVDPKNSGASQDTADFYSNLIRGIEQHSDASTCYDVGGWYAAATGLGFVRVVSDYEDDESFFQKLIIKAVDNPETILIDPDHKKVDGSDAEWCFVICTMTKDDYKRKFSASKMAKDSEAKGWSSNNNSWIRDDEVIVAEYYWKDYTTATLYQVFNNQTGEVITATAKPGQDLIDAGVLTIMDSRPIQECKVRWIKLNDVEILEETSWPGKTIPVVTIKGDELWIDGKRHLKGAVQDAMDSQRVLNSVFSSAAELVALQPKAPYIGDIRQFMNFEHLWRDANTAPLAYLPYNAVSENGQTLPPPIRQSQEQPIQAAMALVQQAGDNLKNVFGVFDASLGAAGNETSGTAIIARTAQSHTTTYHFYDNLAKSVQAIGSILVDTIPTFYADEREVQMITRAGTASTGTINREDGHGDLTQGKFGVVVDTGPSFATRRQDSVTHMLDLGRVYPQGIPLFADLIASESDWPGSQEIATRLRTMLPPAILQSEEASKSGISPKQQAQQLQQQLQQMQQQMQQLQQQHQQADGLLHQAMEENKMLKLKGSIDLEKANMDKDIKQQQLHLDEAEAELSFKLKMRELELQERQLKMAEAKMGIDVANSMNKMNNDMHDHTMDHHERMSGIAIKIPTVGSDFDKEHNPKGFDATLNNVSGEDVGNA